MTTSSAVATVRDPNKDKRVELQRFISSLEPEIAKALPNAMNADRMARIALTLVRQSDIQANKDGKPQNSLAVCDPMSVAGALLTASVLGLEPGVNQEAYLVPYKRECTLIVGYQGLAKLFWQHPLAHYLDAHAVYENDLFDYEYGLDQFLRHKPARGERGPVTDYWAAGKLTTGANRFVVLSIAEAKALRGGKVGPSGSIADPMRWMERKTALRQLLKLLPKSTALAAAMAVDEQRGSVLAERGVPTSIANDEPIAALPSAMEDVAPQGQRVTMAEISGAVPVEDPEDVDEDAMRAFAEGGA